MGGPIFQCRYFTKYTPVDADITFNGKVLNNVTFYLTADSTVTLKDSGGSATQTGVALSKGYHPILVSRIVSVTGGDVYLCHNGDQAVN